MGGMLPAEPTVFFILYPVRMKSLVLGSVVVPLVTNRALECYLIPQYYSSIALVAVA